MRQPVESSASDLNDPRWIALVDAQRELIARQAELNRGPEAAKVVAAALRSGGAKYGNSAGLPPVFPAVRSVDTRCSSGPRDLT